jgi:deoxycytidylate deaminase
MLKRIPFPELFFGFVAPIGVDLPPTVEIFAQALDHFGYRVKVLKVTDAFDEIPQISVKRTRSPLADRYKTYIKFGNAVRKKYKDSEILAALAIAWIFRSRKFNPDTTPMAEERVAYVVHQFKRKEEVDLFRSVYGRLFFQISVYSSRKMRAESLSRKFADGAQDSDFDKYRGPAEDLIRIDENELETTHGQRLRQVFHLADFIINKDSTEDEKTQIQRFLELLFGNNARSPTKPEYGMYAAKSASLRSLDLSRQVGAAIFSSEGEVISMGCNEVPKGNGGTYWTDDDWDDRDYRRKEDPNEKIKHQNLTELLSRMKKAYLKPDSYADLEEIFKARAVQDSKVMESLEYGRIIHAEMSAIADAARLGRSVKDATLFCTTFPCHICAKHIVASGIKRVVFLEPYPKSHAFDLHYDSIKVEGESAAGYDNFPKTDFVHFSGVSPRRYRDFFEKGNRKDSNEAFLEWGKNGPRPIIDVKLPIWCLLEASVFSDLPAVLKNAAKRLSKRKLEWNPPTKADDSASS